MIGNERKLKVCHSRALLSIPTDPLVLWERVRVRVRVHPHSPTVYDRKCNEMQPNATDLKVSPLLATPNEATVATSRATLVQCVGVSGVPNEATVASFSASPLGVNEAKWSQMSPLFENLSLTRA